MKAICLHDKQSIEQYLHRNVELHLYEIGDLDDFFWPYTTWYATQDESQRINQLALLYTGGPTPVLLGLSEDQDKLTTLLQAICHLLPREFDTHLSGDAIKLFAQDYTIAPYGIHYKMSLRDPARLHGIDTTRVVRLTQRDLGAIEELYEQSYPGNWFEQRMLETGHYFGVRVDGKLVSIAGVHVYAPQLKVATVGNVTTHPTYRGHGFGTAVCAKLSQTLLQTVEHIGLNVKEDNQSALNCYKRLGFARVGAYGEYRCVLK